MADSSANGWCRKAGHSRSATSVVLIELVSDRDSAIARQRRTFFMVVRQCGSRTSTPARGGVSGFGDVEFQVQRALRYAPQCDSTERATTGLGWQSGEKNRAIELACASKNAKRAPG